MDEINVRKSVTEYFATEGVVLLDDTNEAVPGIYRTIRSTSAIGTLLTEPSESGTLKDSLELGFLKGIIDSTETASKRIAMGFGELSLKDVHARHEWKLAYSFFAKVLDFNNEFVTLEVVVDKEQGYTEERDFKVHYFEGYEIDYGAFFKLHIFQRPNAEMFQITRAPQATPDDFPKVDFEKFARRSVFRRRAQ